MNSTKEENSHLSWKEKYELNERQLSKFQEQAGKIRELLNKKMAEFESQIIAAERKRDEALGKVEKLEMACQDKDEAIGALREKIARMNDERHDFLLLDNEKMTKIKDWVKVKFTELYRELEKAKAERDNLQKQVDRDSSRRSDKYSISSNASNYYEEVFGELLDELEAEKSYESISAYQLNQNSSDIDISLPEPPAIPPRRASIRADSRLLNSSRPKPLKACGLRRSSPSLVRKLFNLPEDDAAIHVSDSMQRLNEEVSKMSEDSKRSPWHLDSNYKEPMSPLYSTLQATISGMEFENHENPAPVYSTMEGMASQIRKEPFTGETSDSDFDGDEVRTANNLPIKEATPRSSDPTPKTHGPSDSSPSPAKRQLRTCASFTEQNMRQETLAKAGWLTKLGGRIKNWKKRWFTLMDGKLNYFKTRHDMYRKPVGWIDLKQVTQITKSDQALTFEIATPERTYYLTADTETEMEDWLRVLKNAIKRFCGARLMSKAGQKTIYSGWITKAKCGVSKHCWGVLKEKTMLFYKTDVEHAPIGAVSLREIISVTPVSEDVVLSDLENSEEEGSYRLMIQCLKDTHPTYFVVSSHSEMELWLHHLQQMCSGGDVNNQTDFEQIITKLMNIDGDSGSRYWRNKIMIHSKNLLKESLTSLPSPDLKKEAINLWKSIQLFSNTPINETAIDYHISLSQDIIQLCIIHPELQTEIYCQLIKQTSKYRSKPNQSGSSYTMSNDWVTNRDSSYGTIDQQPVSAFVYMQCWQILALCTSIFLPKLKILWLLKAHLHRNANESSDVGRYAIYCQRSLERTLMNGEREARPSRIEAISLIARNPYFRVYPMSVPVYFVNNSYQLFSFDGSTTIAEFNLRINEEVGIRDCSESGYALFTDNPVASVEHCLQSDLKLCDVISKWEQAAQQLKPGRFERSKAIKLTYKNRLFFKGLSGLMTEKEKLLHVFHINNSLQIGYLIANPPVLFRLTALLAQIEFGDYVDHFKLLEDIILKIYPNYSSMEDGRSKKQILQSVADVWSKLKGRLLKDCIASYISIAHTIPLYGCKLFKAQEKLQHGGETHQNIWLAIEEEKIIILTKQMEVTCSYDWSRVITFGGFKEDFMLVIQPDENTPETTIRHLFVMPTGRVLEVTLLIASYINAVVTRCGINLDSTEHLSSCDSEGKQTSVQLTSHHDHLWDMESQD